MFADKKRFQQEICRSIWVWMIKSEFQGFKNTFWEDNIRVA